MPHAITEDATNANHSVGLTEPDNGETGTWWGVKEASLQQVADRTQALFQGSLSGDGANTKTLSVRLDATFNSDDRFVAVDSSAHQYYQQTDITSAGKLVFPMDPLPPGATIVSVTMRLAGSTHGALPATMPTISVIEVEDQTDTQLATATDASANVAAYDEFHSVEVAVGVEIAPMKYYYIRVTGEASTNAATGLDLVGVFVELGPTAP